MENLSSSEFLQPVCDSHVKEELKYYCCLCRSHVCSDCILERHSAHVHDVKRASSRQKEIRFDELFKTPDVPGQPVKNDIEFVEILKQIEEYHNKTNETAEIINERIDKRAEEFLRHIKKIKNQLLEECRTITKQNHTHLNKIKQRVYLKLEKRPEIEISNTFQQTSIHNADYLKWDVFRQRELVEHDNVNILYPQIDLPVFEPGEIDTILMKSMFGAVLVKGAVNPETSFSATELDYPIPSKENIEPRHTESKQTMSNCIGYRLNKGEISPQMNNYNCLIENDRSLNGNKWMDHFSEKQKSFTNIHTNSKEIHPNLGHQDINASIKNNKPKGFSNLDHKYGNYETDELLLSSVKPTIHVSSVLPSMNLNKSASLREDNIPSSILQPVPHLTIDCEDKPVCCICVMGSDVCWIHQGFSTTNSLFDIGENKRKKLSLNLLLKIGHSSLQTP